MPHFFAAVLEYMLSDVLKLTSNYVHYVQNNSREEINEQDVKIAMYADKVSAKILFVNFSLSLLLISYSTQCKM